jgi:hypothetical protein
MDSEQTHHTHNVRESIYPMQHFNHTRKEIMLDASAPHHDHARGAPTCVITHGKRRLCPRGDIRSCFLGQKMWTIFETRKTPPYTSMRCFVVVLLQNECAAYPAKNLHFQHVYE